MIYLVALRRYLVVMVYPADHPWFPGAQFVMHRHWTRGSAERHLRYLKPPSYIYKLGHGPC